MHFLLRFFSILVYWSSSYLKRVSAEAKGGFLELEVVIIVLEVLQLCRCWRCWISGGVGVLEVLEFWRCYNSSGADILEVLEVAEIGRYWKALRSR